MGCFYSKDNKILLLRFIKKQKKEEYQNKRKNIYDIGNHKPYSVYYTSGNNNIKLDGLCSLCENNIHISIGNNPNRLILSLLNKDENENIIKDSAFHIFKFTYEKIENIEQITQYHIYTAIQDYLINDKNIIVAA